MKKFFVAMVLIVMTFTAMAIGKTKPKQAITVDCPIVFGREVCTLGHYSPDLESHDLSKEIWLQRLLNYILPVIPTETYSEADGAGLPLCSKNTKYTYIRIPWKYIKSDNIHDEPFTESEKPWWL